MVHDSRALLPTVESRAPDATTVIPDGAAYVGHKRTKGPNDKQELA